MHATVSPGPAIKRLHCASHPEGESHGEIRVWRRSPCYRITSQSTAMSIGSWNRCNVLYDRGCSRLCTHCERWDVKTASGTSCCGARRGRSLVAASGDVDGSWGEEKSPDGANTPYSSEFAQWTRPPCQLGNMK